MPTDPEFGDEDPDDAYDAEDENDGTDEPG